MFSDAHRRPHRTARAAALAVAAAGCAPSACFSCLQPPAAPLPESQRVYDGIQFHATTAGIAAGAGRLATSFTDVMPPSVVFDVSPTPIAKGGITATLCPQRCSLSGSVGALSMAVKAPDQFVLSAPLTMAGMLVLQGSPTCDATVAIATTGTVTTTFAVDPLTRHLGAEVASAAAPFATTDASFVAPGCGGVDLSPVAEALVAQAGAVNAALLRGAATRAEAGFCLSCTAYAGGCPAASSCAGTPSYCRDSGGKCLYRPLGPVGIARLGAAFTAFFASPDAFFELHLAPGQKQPASLDPPVTAAGELDLRYVGAAATGTVDRCVPGPVPPPGPVARIDFDGAAAALAAAVPALANGYHVALAVTEPLLTQALRGFYAGGGMCFAFDQRVTRLLSAESLGVVLPSVGLLAPKTAPAMVSVRAKKPPRVEVGAGETAPDGQGGKKLVKPHLTLVVDDLEIAVTAAVEDRQARLFAVIAQARLGLGMEVVPDRFGKPALEPVVGDLRELTAGARVTHRDLVAEPNDQVVAAVQVLLALAQSVLAGQLVTFSLPGLGGMEFDVLAVKGIGPRPLTSTYEAIGLFANVKKGSNIVRAADTRIAVESVEDPPPGPGRATAMVRVEAVNAGPAAEVQLRVDGGFWSPFTRPGSIRVDHPVLALRGRHRIEARARVQGQWRSLDASSAAVELEVRRPARPAAAQ